MRGAEPSRRPAWGILGGLGPRASAAFLSSIYGAASGPEQRTPAIFLVSDPSFPDRSTAVLQRLNEEELLLRTEASLRSLADLGAERLVMCCVTLHYLLPRISSDSRSKIVSLIDLIFEAVLREQRTHLVLCSDGTRANRLFEDHPCWKAAHPRLVMPDASGQSLIHRMIYELKEGGVRPEHGSLVRSLCSRHRADSAVAGCTEFHLLSAGLAKRDDSTDWIDPLAILAERICQESQGAAV
jgi:aspartate racemase